MRDEKNLSRPLLMSRDEKLLGNLTNFSVCDLKLAPKCYKLINLTISYLKTSNLSQIVLNLMHTCQFDDSCQKKILSMERYYTNSDLLINLYLVTCLQMLI